MLVSVSASMVGHEQGTTEFSDSYLARTGRERLLTHGEEIELSRGVKRGDGRSRQRLIEKNLRLVVSVAKS